MSKITSKSTKPEITAAYEEEKSMKEQLQMDLKKALSELESLKNAKFDPAQEKESKRKSEVITKAEEAVDLNLGALIEVLKGNLLHAIDSVSSNVESQMEAYKAIEDAIEIKKKELQDLLGIESELYSLVALKNAHAEEIAKFKEDMEARRETALSELETTKQYCKDLLAQTKLEIKTEKEEAEIKREREEEEYDYEFNRRKIQRENSVTDWIEQRKKDHEKWEEMKEEEIEAREAAVAKREESIEGLENKVADLENKLSLVPDQIADASAKAAKEAEERAKTSYGFETRYLKKEYEADKALLESKKETLEVQVTELKAQVADLQSKLNAAYGEIKDVAIKTVDGSKAERYASDVTRLADKSNK